MLAVLKQKPRVIRIKEMDSFFNKEVAPLYEEFKKNPTLGQPIDETFAEIDEYITQKAKFLP